MQNALRTEGIAPRRTLLTRSAAALVLAAAAVAVQLPIIPTAPPVYIRWADRVDETQKVEAASQLCLLLLDTREDGVWITKATDTSKEAIRAIVQDPRVADTYNVDRGNFELPREWTTPQAWLRRTFPAFEEISDGYLEGVMRPAVIPLGALLVVAWVALRRALSGRPGWLGRGIPGMSPHALAVFRLVYGGAMLRLWMWGDPAPLPLEVQRLEAWVARTSVVRDLSANAMGLSSLRMALVCSLVLFTAGLVPRVTLAIPRRS